MKGFFLNKQAQLKALVPKRAEEISEEEAKQLPPWYAGRTKRQEEKTVLLHQERVARYHQIYELHANKVDVATIAHHMKMSRQGVYNYLKMTQPPERTRINQPRKPLIEPYKDYLITR